MLSPGRSNSMFAIHPVSHTLVHLPTCSGSVDNLQYETIMHNRFDILLYVISSHL